MGLLIGCDPELFLKKNGTLISAHGVIKGTKKHPFPVNLGAVQVDGMAVEFNTRPASNVNEFTHTISEVLRQLRGMLPNDIETIPDIIVEFDLTYLENQPPEAKRLGCSPDFDAYKGCQNPLPKEHPSMRTASGHLHIGWTEGQEPLDDDHFASCCSLIRQLDYYLGVPSIIVDNSHKRREMYGKAGSFRPKSYGVEYRVLSSFWVNSVKYQRNIYNYTVKAFNSLLDGFDAHKEFGSTRLNAERIINENDVTNAICVIKELNLDIQNEKERLF